ncbi:MAG: helicase HerA-like domain-containing protein [Pseudomonadota bacterium]
MLAQLGARVQHALRAYTPAERKAIKAAAESFRENPDIDTQQVITELGTGEALVSTLDAKGAPGVVQRTLIRPPSSRLGPATDAERQAVMQDSPVSGKYDDAIDRESAYELLAAREEKAAKEAEEIAEKEAREKAKAKEKRRKSSSSRRQTASEAAFKSAMRTAARDITKYVLRGVFGGRRR